MIGVIGSIPIDKKDLGHHVGIFLPESVNELLKDRQLAISKITWDIGHGDNVINYILVDDGLCLRIVHNQAATSNCVAPGRI